MMAEMDGYEFVKKINENAVLKAIHIIALTADPKMEDAAFMSEHGFQGYLPKPITLEELEKCILKIVTEKIQPKETQESLPPPKTSEEAEVPEAPISKEEPTADCKGIKVLVVEDSLPNQMLIQAYFDELACEGDYANNGKEAVDKLKDDPDKYDLVLMDLQMPVMGGIDATVIIRKEIDKEIPVIALSAAVLDEDKKRPKIKKNPKNPKNPKKPGNPGKLLQHRRQTNLMKN